jgi:hypothetical protein
VATAVPVTTAGEASVTTTTPAATETATSDRRPTQVLAPAQSWQEDEGRDWRSDNDRRSRRGHGPRRSEVSRPVPTPAPTPAPVEDDDHRGDAGRGWNHDRDWDRDRGDGGRWGR